MASGVRPNRAGQLDTTKLALVVESEKCVTAVEVPQRVEEAVDLLSPFAETVGFAQGEQRVEFERGFHPLSPWGRVDIPSWIPARTAKDFFHLDRPTVRSRRLPRQPAARQERVQLLRDRLSPVRRGPHGLGEPGPAMRRERLPAPLFPSTGHGYMLRSMGSLIAACSSNPMEGEDRSSSGRGAAQLSKASAQAWSQLRRAP